MVLTEGMASVRVTHDVARGVDYHVYAGVLTCANLTALMHKLLGQARERVALLVQLDAVVFAASGDVPVEDYVRTCNTTGVAFVVSDALYPVIAPRVRGLARASGCLATCWRVSQLRQARHWLSQCYCLSD